MGNIVDVQITSEKVILKIPHKNIVTEIDNVASFDSNNKKLVSTGVTQEVFRAQHPKLWRKYKDRLEFRPIFDAEVFSPEIAVMALLLWWNNVSKQVIPATTIFRWQVKLEINISFDKYKVIPLHQQHEFEYLVSRYLYAKKLSINDDEKQQDKRKSPPVWSLLILNYLFGIAFLLLGIVPVFAVITWASMAALPSTLDFLLFIIILFGGMFGFMYLGDFISRVLWLLLMRPFFESQMLIRTLTYQTNLPLKHKLSRTMSFLIDRLLVGKR